MTPDYRALCAELADALAEWRLGGGPPEDTADADLVARARALLAEADGREPASAATQPSDEEVRQWVTQCADLTRLGCTEHYWAFDVSDDHVCDIARAVLAKWGRSAPQPEPERLTAVTISDLLNPAYEITGEEIAEGAQLVDGEWWNPLVGCDSLQIVVDNTRAVLVDAMAARCPTPAAAPAIPAELEGHGQA